MKLTQAALELAQKVIKAGGGSEQKAQLQQAVDKALSALDEFNKPSVQLLGELLQDRVNRLNSTLLTLLGVVLAVIGMAVAAGWAVVRSVTVPLVGPSTFFLLIMNVIASFQVFDVIFVMTGGGPGNSTSVLVTYAYRNGFQIREPGYGAAIGIVILIITLAFTFVQWKTSRTRDLVG